QRVYDDIDRTLAAVDAGRLAEAGELILQPLSDDTDELDGLISRLIGLNNDHAAAAARDIATLRRRTTRLALLLDALSVLIGAVLLAAAVRAARLYHRALDEQRRLAEARAAELDHYAARVAHDLKAPLASLVLGTAVAVEYPSETPRTLAKIQRTSHLMGEMIDALLAVARVEAQSRAPAIAVAPVVEVLVDEVRPAAAAIGATVCVAPLPPTAAVACGSGVLASVLSNLLQNAVKYIAEADGTRVITLRVSEGPTTVRFEVEDTGPGLPPALEEHVFERYVRGERSTGLGLGLATVKHLVETAGGRLGVRSHHGQGCCFWVELPRATLAPQLVAS
ncbi:MAG TPA: HAMP domain-containing sensor histidine kinase, partial [Polyangia bacterium]